MRATCGLKQHVSVFVSTESALALRLEGDAGQGAGLFTSYRSVRIPAVRECASRVSVKRRISQGDFLFAVELHPRPQCATFEEDLWLGSGSVRVWMRLKGNARRLRRACQKCVLVSCHTGVDECPALW